jgi:hypothetical protein
MLPVVVLAPIVFNGSFDSGLDSWTTGGALGASWVTNGGSPDGGGAALIGDPRFNTSCVDGVPQPSVPVGNGYIAQTITVPNQPNPTLTYYYRMFTQDWTGSHDPNQSSTPPTIDWFGVYANALDDLHHLPGSYAGVTQSTPLVCPPPLQISNWTRVSISLSQYEGQQVTLYFAVWNQLDGLYNTYVYVDGVTVSFGG